MKKTFILKKIIMSLVIVLSLISLASCSSFFGGETSIEIASITHETMSDGNIKITITYTDESKLPDEFIIPKGTDGESGVGIKNITTVKNDDEKKTTLTITYTDDKIEPTIFEVPDGLGVLGIETKYDEEENETYMIVTYSDGSKSAPLILPKGDKGQDGNGISSYEIVTNEDESTTITFHFTQSEDFVITIPAPKKGNGIDSITSSEIEDKYILIIRYTDPVLGTQELEFNKPAQPNKWLSGTGPSASDGDDGDYYMDTYHKKIYHKENGEWYEVVNFGDTNVIYTVTFNLNDSDESPASFPAGYSSRYRIKRGTYFSDIENNYGGVQIPIPTRPGYIFKGWYRVPNITAINGAFTDLTPIFSDLTLYAIWEQA